MPGAGDPFAPEPD